MGRGMDRRSTLPHVAWKCTLIGWYVMVRNFRGLRTTNKGHGTWHHRPGPCLQGPPRPRGLRARPPEGRQGGGRAVPQHHQPDVPPRAFPMPPATAQPAVCWPPATSRPPLPSLGPRDIPILLFPPSSNYTWGRFGGMNISFGRPRFRVAPSQAAAPLWG